MCNVTEIADLKKGWSRETCWECRGHGIVPDYGSGYDFYGPKDCSTCKGAGMLCVTPTGRYMDYPGGKFLGRKGKDYVVQ